MRPHHWLKNGLVFVPVLLNHDVFDTGALWSGAVAFVAFSLIASAIYLLNDVKDLEADRRHPTKCKRPLAAGEITVAQAYAAVPLLLVAAFCLSFLVSQPTHFLLALSTYLFLALAYLLFFRIMRTAGPSNVMLVTFLIPVSAILLGSGLLGEDLLPRHFAGMAAIFVGLALIDGRILRIAQAKPAPIS